MTVEFYAFNGDVLNAQLADEPHDPSCPLRRAVYVDDSEANSNSIEVWLFRARPKDCLPSYVQVTLAQATAIKSRGPAIRPAPTDGPGEPDSVQSDPPARPADPRPSTRLAANISPKGSGAEPPPLDQTAMQLLKKLERRKAFDERSAKPLAVLVKELGSRSGTKVQGAKDALLARDLIATRRGRGTWLTAAGRTAAAASRRR